MFSKVVIVGHKNTHTHSHIHSSYFKAFKYLGYETYWVDQSQGNIFNEPDILYFTEGQVDTNITLRNDCYYILHHCNLEKYINAGCKYVQLGNYLKFCDDGKNHYYPGSELTKIKNQVFADYQNKLLYQMWATDLLPHEIDETTHVKYNTNLKEIYYVGTIWHENINEINPFVKACHDSGIGFINKVNVTDEENKILTNNSYLSVDLRGAWHRECGYFPCRVFKNISYGKFTGTNSLNVFNVMDGNIPYSEDTNELFYLTEKQYKDCSFEKMRDLMLFVKENHTFINRIDSLISFIKSIY